MPRSTLFGTDRAAPWTEWLTSYMNVRDEKKSKELYQKGKQDGLSVGRYLEIVHAAQFSVAKGIGSPVLPFPPTP